MDDYQPTLTDVLTLSPRYLDSLIAGALSTWREKWEAMWRREELRAEGRWADDGGRAP